MGSSLHALNDWQLLASVHLVFAAQTPTISAAHLGDTEREILLNLVTILEFELWLVPDALQEAEGLSLSGSAHHGFAALTSLLDIFEQYVDNILSHHSSDSEYDKVGSSAVSASIQSSLLIRHHVKRYPKLRALQAELLQRHESTSGIPLDHAHDLRHLVWFGITLEGLRDVVTAVEDFNRTVNRLSSNTLEDDSCQGMNNDWKEDEVQSILHYEQMRENMDTIFTALMEELSNCGSSHTALVHFTGLRSLRMLLSTCTGKGGWRQALCELNVDEMSGLGNRGFEASKDLCGATRGPPHQLLRIVCSKSAVSHDSDQTVARIRADSKRSLSDLLEERAQHQMNTEVAPFFSKKKKKTVAVILAQFLVKLVGCRWLQNDWNAETIFFLPDPSSGDEPDLQTPYILASLTTDQVFNRTVDTLEYYCSFVFAFGLLLLELELDQRISITAADEEDAEEDYPAAYMALIRMFTLRKEDLDDAYILQIINSCLEFRNRVESVQHPSFDEDLKFRAAISKYILTPLIERLQVAHPDVPLDEIVDKPKATVVRPSSQRLRGHGQLFSKNPKRKSTSQHHAVHHPPSRMATGSTFTTHPTTRTSYLSGQRPRTRRDFKLAIICALPLEADAVKAMFDKRWDDQGDSYGKASSDQNAYSTGVIGRHNVVLAHMPGMGKESAARVAANCRSSFEGIKLALVVGICGGVPSPTNGEEILLGDVVISEGLVCYDFGRQLPGRFVRKDGVLDNYPRPPPEIRSLLNKLKGRWDRNLLQEKTFAYLTNVQDELGHSAKYPGSECDKLFDASYRHRHQQPFACGTCSESQPSNDFACAKALASTCEDLGCDDSRLVQRERLSQPPLHGQSNKIVPMVHIGKVASGSIVMKSGLDRDRIANEEEVIAFEMEGAGVWDTFTCVIIKGVCDYADSHKSKKWQGYAAATAAACTKAFLEHWTSTL